MARTLDLRIKSATGTTRVYGLPLNQDASVALLVDLRRKGAFDASRRSRGRCDVARPRAGRWLVRRTVTHATRRRVLRRGTRSQQEGHAATSSPWIRRALPARRFDAWKAENRAMVTQGLVAIESQGGRVRTERKSSKRRRRGWSTLSRTTDPKPAAARLRPYAISCCSTC